MRGVRRLIGVIVLPLLLLAGAWAPAAPAREPTTPSARPIRVVFFSSMGPIENPWRQAVSVVMRAAAHDLDIHLVEHIVGPWPGDVVEMARRVVSGPDKPDYLLLTIHGGIGVRVLEVAEQAGVPVFVINSGLLPTDRARFGGPRQRYKHWLGQMLPDDELAGYQLAWRLLEAATVSLEDSQGTAVRLVALEGARGDTSAMQRLEGLRRAVAEWKNAELLQRVSASWQRDLARRKTTLLLRRYPDVQVVWTANDDMALGALGALEASGLHPGEDALVGGIDWTPESLQALHDGKLVTSLGGHFLEGAWALVLLYDYHHGMDFASERLDWRTEMLPLTRANVGDFLHLFRAPDWEAFDFRAFSKVANSGLKRYDFSLQALLAQRRDRSPGRPLDTHGP